MRKFFASLRRLLALERAHIALGAVVQDAISRIIIPKLQHMANAERSSEEKESIESLIREYAEYADPRNPKSRVFSDLANYNFNESVKRMGIPPSMAEDMATDLAGDFYSLPSHQHEFEKFNPLDGPLKLSRYWNMLVHNQVFSRFRQHERYRTKHPELPREEGDSYRDIPAPIRETEMDSAMLKQVLKDLKKYVHNKADSYGHQGQYVPEIFDTWLDVAMVKGADAVNLSRDVYEPVLRDMERRGEKAPSKTMINEAWPIIKKLTARFFEEEMDMRISDRLKKQLRLSSEMIVTTELFRRKLARWILGM
jgi:hypothetical protein